LTVSLRSLRSLRPGLRRLCSLQDWQKEDPRAIRAALTEKMVDASDKLARFVGLDVYRDAGGSTRADLFGNEVFLEKPALLHKLAEEKLNSVRKDLILEGWGWVEINPERDYDFVHRCGRLQPLLVNPPAELLERKSQLEDEWEETERLLEMAESDDVEERQDAIQYSLDVVKQELTAFVDFDATQKSLAGCFVSIGHDGALFLDKGPIKPEQRKLLAKLLGEGDYKQPVKPKTKNALPESLRRDLAADRMEVAQVAIARNPEIALDLLTFRTASAILGKNAVLDGPNVEFHLPKPGKEREASVAKRDLAAIGKSLPTGWLKHTSEAERFEAFRSLPEAARLELLAYCVALTLKPRLGPIEGEEATAFDAALSLTGSSVRL
jgi:ParB family chromosome partitioning protein